jgi:WD40 repeat protein/serine/threonine protein kinase
MTEKKKQDEKAVQSSSAAGETQPSVVSTQSGSQPAAQGVRLPEQFGRYRIVRRLGQGAMGDVYLADDTQLDRQVALKVPKLELENKNLLSRFYREARTAAGLHHRNICPVHDVGEIDGVHYLTMAYIEGRPLSAYVKPGKPLPVRSAVAIIRKLALALSAAHGRGILHRDLKPANIMVDGDKQPVVMDFGLARKVDAQESRLTQTGTLIGTPAYMSPEQVKGELDELGPSSDVYSLGIIFYELLTAQVPFEGPIASVLGQILAVDPQPPSVHRQNLDPALEAICLKAMAKPIEERYASMADLAAALTVWLKGLSGQPADQPQEEAAEALPVPQAEDDTVVPSEANMDHLIASLVDDQPPAILDRVRQRGHQSSGRKFRRVNPLKGLWNRIPPNNRWIVTAAAGGALALLLGVIVIIRTKDGTVEIDTKGADAKITVDGDKMIIKTVEEDTSKQQPAVTLIPDDPPGEVRVFKGHTGRVFWAEFWSNAQRILSGGENGEMFLWNVESGQLLKKFEGHAETVHAGKFLNNGRQLLSCGQDGTVRLWNAETADEIWQQKRHSTWVYGLAVLPGKNQALSCSHDRTVRLWDLDKGRQIRQFEAASTWLRNIAVSNDGRFAVTGGGTNSPKLWDVNSGKIIRSFAGHTRYPTAVAISSDGRRILSGSFDHSIRLWDIENGKSELRQFLGHTSTVHDVCFSPNGRRLLSASYDQSVRLWEVESGREVWAGDKHSGSVYGVSFSPDERAALSCGSDGTIRLWRLPKPETTRSDNTPPLTVAPFSAEQARKHQQAWAKHLDVPVEMTNTIDMSFRLIPPGEFQMGSPDSETDRGDDELQHRVEITQPFYLGAQEVTVGQFRQFVEATRYRTDAEKDGEGGRGWNESTGRFESDVKYNWKNTGFKQTDDHPVGNISWNDAVAFASWLSEIEKHTYRLPTEAEWEFACRAGSATLYSHGDGPEGLAQFGNIADAAFNRRKPDGRDWGIEANDGYVFAAPVGRKQPNTFALSDVHGNVWEWCRDWYGEDYYANSPRNDPTGPSTGTSRVVRGGSWYTKAGSVRSASRNKSTPTHTVSHIGFRVARSMESDLQTATNEPDNWHRLFNGKDLTGWQPMESSGSGNAVHKPRSGGWSVVDGLLVRSSKASGWLKSNREYGDFVLKLEFKVPPGGNSGVNIRSPEAGILANTGMEIQITDDFSDRFKDADPKCRTGAILGVDGRNKSASRPVGEWNAFEIRCDGDQVTVILNGELTAAANMQQNSQLKDRPRSGYIGLSGVAGKIGNAAGVAFRNIRIKELNTDSAPASADDAASKKPAESTGRPLEETYEITRRREEYIERHLDALKQRKEEEKVPKTKYARQFPTRKKLSAPFSTGKMDVKYYDKMECKKLVQDDAAKAGKIPYTKAYVDKSGKLRQVESYDKNHALVEGSLSCAVARYWYDKQGNRIQEAFYGVDGKPGENGQLVVVARHAYEGQRRAETRFYAANGNSSAEDHLGVHRRVFRDGKDELEYRLDGSHRQRWLKPLNLGKRINDDGARLPVLSPDGKELYFSTANFGGRASARKAIYRCIWTGTQWSDPEIVLAGGTPLLGLRAGMSSDGKFLAFASWKKDPYNHPLQYPHLPNHGHADIYVTERVNGKWQAVRNAGRSPNQWNEEGGVGFVPGTHDLYFSTDHGRGGGYLASDTLCLSKWQGSEWGEPRELDVGPAITPIFSDNGSRLYFGSQRKGAFGFNDIWMVEKNGGGWSKAINLGSPINGREDDVQPAFSPDSSIMYYSNGHQRILYVTGRTDSEVAIRHMAEIHALNEAKKPGPSVKAPSLAEAKSISDVATALSSTSNGRNRQNDQ